MDIRTLLKKMDRSKKIGICALAVLTAGALYLSAASQYQTKQELAEEAAAWEAELAKMQAEEDARLQEEIRPRLIETVELTTGGTVLPITAYLPTKIADVPQSVELSSQIRLLGPGTELAEGTEAVLTLPEDVPASVMIWRDPIGEETPAESVNYVREELDGGIRCVFTVAYAGHTSVDYQFDIKIDAYNQGKLGFTAVCPADAEVQEMTNG